MSSDGTDAMDDSASAPIAVSCTDLDAAIAFYAELGFRLDMIMPADAPRTALVSGHGITLRLDASGRKPAIPIPVCDSTPHEFLVNRSSAADMWVSGRAGMQYRDLVPDRLGGHFIASHIRIPDGGPVPDYVHYHKVGFQMIYCKRGWVRVVYEDQGRPFVMQAGDCVLQPPTIRHRVLEASPGMEVIEISLPAEHETWRDHALELPTADRNSQRLFAGQRFVRHIAADAIWQRTHESPASIKGREFRDTGISSATDGLASVRVLRITPGVDDEHLAPQVHDGDFLFLMVLEGRLDLISRALGSQTLDADDACVISAGTDFALQAREPTEVLEVALPQTHRDASRD